MVQRSATRVYPQEDIAKWSGVSSLPSPCDTTEVEQTCGTIYRTAIYTSSEKPAERRTGPRKQIRSLMKTRLFYKAGSARR